MSLGVKSNYCCDDSRKVHSTPSMPITYRLHYREVYVPSMAEKWAITTHSHNAPQLLLHHRSSSRVSYHSQSPQRSLTLHIKNTATLKNCTISTLPCTTLTPLSCFINNLDFYTNTLSLTFLVMR